MSLSGHAPAGERGPVSLVERFRSGARGRHDIVGEDASRRVDCLFALADQHRSFRTAGEKIEAIEGPRFRKGLPEPPYAVCGAVEGERYKVFSAAGPIESLDVAEVLSRAVSVCPPCCRLA